MSRRALVVAALLCATAADAAEFRTGQPVMGTLLEVTVVAGDVAKARAAATAAIDTIERWDDILTIWRPEGELAQLNRAAGKGHVPISADLHRALEQMIDLVEETHGAFDPGVGPLVAFWSSATPPSTKSTPKGGDVAIRSVLSLAAGSAALTAGAALDPGAVGKGIGLDAAARVLRAAGVDAALLDFGGSSQLALGGPPDSPRGWPVAVTGLLDGELRGVVVLRDAALSTSRARPAGAPEGTLIDPRSRRPVDRARVVTVRSHSAAAADAWSTALVVLGRAGVPLARRSAVDVFLADAAGSVEDPEFIEVTK